MVFERTASSSHFKEEAESGLEEGGLAMRTSAGVRHSDLQK